MGMPRDTWCKVASGSCLVSSIKSPPCFFQFYDLLTISRNMKEPYATLKCILFSWLVQRVVAADYCWYVLSHPSFKLLCGSKTTVFSFYSHSVDTISVPSALTHALLVKTTGAESPRQIVSDVTASGWIPRPSRLTVPRGGRDARISLAVPRGHAWNKVVGKDVSWSMIHQRRPRSTPACRP